MKELEYLLFKILKKVRLKGLKGGTVHGTSKIESGTSFINSNMDKYSFCGYNCDIINAKIGSFCSIANNVKVGGGAHPIEWVSTSPVFYKGRDSVKKKFSSFARGNHLETIIQNDVWIGDNAIIKQGVTIAHGSVVGMGSVVTKDVEPYSVIGGVPAKLIRKRFEKEVIMQLLESEWWDLDEKVLSRAAEHIQIPKNFIDYLSKNENNI